MSQTRARILTAARALFNARGVAQVATRDIAAYLGMSQGNLTYHFPKRDQLVESLYLEAMDKLGAQVAAVSEGAFSLFRLFELQQVQATLQEQYWFLWMDFTAIRQAHSAIADHFKQQLLQRQETFHQMLIALQEAGYMQGDLPHKAKGYLFEQMLLIGNFWPHMDGVFPAPAGGRAAYYARLTLTPLYPYLTPKGYRDWMLIDEAVTQAETNNS